MRTKHSGHVDILVNILNWAKQGFQYKVFDLTVLGSGKLLVEIGVLDVKE